MRGIGSKEYTLSSHRIQNAKLMIPSVSSVISVAKKWRCDRGMLVLIVLFALLLPLANPRVAATDEVQYYVYLRSLRFDGDLDFANDYARFNELNPQSGIDASLLQPNRIRPKTGLYGNIAPIGSAIMWSPFFLLADGLVRVGNMFGAAIPADGFSWPYIYSVCYASALYGLLGLLLSYQLARRYVSVFAATLASVTIWLSTPLVWYMFVQMPFAHATGFFLVALFVTIWERTRTKHKEQSTKNKEALSSIKHQAPSIPRRSWRAWLALGVVGGLMTMTREQLGLMLLIPAVEALIQYGMLLRGRATLRQWMALFDRHVFFLAVFLLTLTPQIAVYQILNGSPRPAGEVSGKLNWCSPHLIDTLIDYDPRPSAWCNVTNDPTAAFPPFAHGALVWSPVFAFAIIGLLLLWRRNQLLCAVFVLALVAQVYVNGAFGTTWHLSGAFGFRRLIEATPFFIVGLALLIDIVPVRWRSWLLIPALLFIAWNAGLVLNASVFNAQTHLRQEGMRWPDLWAWQLELPRKIVVQAENIVFNRCRFMKNGC